MHGMLEILPWVIPGLLVALALGGGLVCLWRMGREPIADRGDRPLAGRLLGILALIGAIPTYGFLTLASTMFGQAPNILIGVPFALGAAGYVVLTGALGYVALANSRFRAWAVAGVLVGPLAVGALTAALVGVTGSIAGAAGRADRDRLIEEGQARQSQAAVEAAERSKAVHVSVVDFAATTSTAIDPATGQAVERVTSIDVTLTIRVDHDITVRHGKDRDIGVRVFPTGHDDDFRLGTGILTGVDILRADHEYRYSINLAYPLLPYDGADPAPTLDQRDGWMLMVVFAEPAPPPSTLFTEYQVTVPIDLTPA